MKYGCKVPIMGAPMAGVSGGLLAAETCRAGALGFIAAGHFGSAKDLEREVSLFRENAPSGAPLALGFIGYSSLKDGCWDRVGMALKTHKPKFVQFFAPAVIEMKGTGGRTNIDWRTIISAKFLHKWVALLKPMLRLLLGWIV